MDVCDRVNILDFFQLMRTFERKYGSESILQKKIELRSSDSMSFPAMDFNVSLSSSKLKKIDLNLMGLLGVDGCLPNFFSDLLTESNHNTKRIKSFLDIFHHRVYFLFFKAWKSQQPDISLELGDESWLDFIHTLLPRLEVQKESLAMAKYFIGHKRTLLALKNILFIKLPNIPFEINTMQADWSKKINDNMLGQCHLELGSNIFIGGRYLSASQKIHIQFGPLSFDKYKALEKQKENIRDLIAKYIDIFQEVTLSAYILYEVNSQCLGCAPMVLGQNVFLSNKSLFVNQKMR